nr:immunoglobulin light chain junction region [Macaca mulatta]
DYYCMIWHSNGWLF